MKRMCDVSIVLSISASMAVVGCATTEIVPDASLVAPASRDADRLLIVDCLLPGQLRRLGRSITFLTPRRPVMVPTSECEIRGGEYVAYDRANFATSLKIWLPKAETGDAEAQTYVGEIFEKGLGLQADPVVAAQWYQKASDQGFSRARINLGYLYESGIGVEKDLVKAMNFYRMAAGFDEGNLEYVTALEVATRKQQVVDLDALKRLNGELAGRVALLEQEKSNFQLRRAELEKQQSEVARQRQLVLQEQAALGEVAGGGDSPRKLLVTSLAQVDELQSNLSASETERKELVRRLQQQQSVTRELQDAYNQTAGDLKQAREELREQEQTLVRLQEKVVRAGSLISSDGVLEAQDRLAEAELELGSRIVDAEAYERAMAQKSAGLEMQLANARTREKALEAELSRVVGALSGAQVDSARLAVRFKLQAEEHTRQLQQMRQQLSISSQELLLVQSRLEASQAQIAGANGQQREEQNDLVDRRQVSEKNITELESRIAAVKNREQMYAAELERLSTSLAGSGVAMKKLERSLKEKITAQQSNLETLQEQLTEAMSEREGVRAELEVAQGVIASNSVELNAIRDQLREQKASYEKQIAASFQFEESLQEELRSKEAALAGEQPDIPALERQLQEQLVTAQQQLEMFSGQFERSEQELERTRRALEQSAGKFASQSSELLSLQDLLEQQQSALVLQREVAEQRDQQLQAEIERLSDRAADSDIRNQLLKTKVAEQKSRIADLTSRYATASRALNESDGGLGRQQNLVAQLRDELQRVRDNSLSELMRSRIQLNENKQALAEAQALYEGLQVEAEKLKSQQSSGSRDLEAKLAAANRQEQTLKRQLDEKSKATEALQQQLLEQEKRYQYELTAARGELERVRDQSYDALLRLSTMENRLTDQKDLIARQESEINKLETDVIKAQAAAEMPANQDFQKLVDAGPSIEIIEPEITVTRGGPALTTNAGSGTVDMIGRISPSNDVLTFKIEGESVPFNDKGVFRYSADGSDASLRMFAINDSGGRTDLELRFSQTRGMSSDTQSGNEISGIEFGQYHALIIGNNNFEKLQNLKTAETDAIAVENLLRVKYGFKTKLLLNASRHDILSAMNEMRETLTTEDNLLIYYAGHGELANSTGYWLPVDAEPDNDANWIPNTDITRYVETINAKHIIVVADSCYSGTLSRTSLSRLSKGLTIDQKRKWYEDVAKSKVRTVFTSGGVKPVLDSIGASRHSIFSAAFLDELESSDSQVVSTYKLFLKVQERVKTEAARIGVDQNPQYAPMQFAGHEAGEFLFLINGKVDSASADKETIGQTGHAQLLAAR